MFNKKKFEDQYDNISETDDIQQKYIFLKKQIEFFKSQNKDYEYDYKDFLSIIEEFHTSKNYEYNIIWLQTLNEIIRLNPNMKKKYFKSAMKIVFSKNNEENIFNYEENNESNDSIKINTLSIFTNDCENIFEIDTYFKNFNRLKNLLDLLIIDFLPRHYNKENNKILLLISNIFFNINKNKEDKTFLKNNYFSVIFNLLIEILCFLCLHNSFRIFEMKNKNSFSIIGLNRDYEYEEEKQIILNPVEEAKIRYLDLINKSNKLFDLYLNLGEKNNLDLIINYQILIKIFIIHCLESQYNESHCIEWFKKIYNNFRINKILKMITESFDDEIFDIFYIDENLLKEESNSNKKKNITKIINPKLVNVNNFFYLCENRSKEIQCKNYFNNFFIKFRRLRKKLIDNKEYVYNGLFILINLMFNEILSKQELNINFNEEFIIITLIKCVVKYMIKTSVAEMLEDNKNNIDNLINLIIDRFGFSLGEKIWKELIVLIKYFYSELSKKEEEYAIKQLSVILKKMIRLKINGIYQFDEKMFYDLLNKVCESKNNIYFVNDYSLFSIYFKNKFKSLKSLTKSISSFSKYFISLIKDKYLLYGQQKTPTGDSDNEIKEKNDTNSEKIIEIFANYILIYFSVYAKYENKNIELFLLNNLNYLNFYFSNTKNLQPKYINLVINVLNNTSDLDNFQCIISYIISLHSSEINILKTKEFVEKSLYLYKKLIIKLIIKLSSTYQIEKLNFLFESIYNKLYANVINSIDYNFLKNILEIYSCMSITKYNEILMNSKLLSKMKTTELIRKYYFSIGKNIYTSIIAKNQKKILKNENEEWCVIDIKDIFDILIKLLKKDNFSIEYKEQIINFIKDKINDIFFFNKIDINMFMDYVIELDKDNLKDFLLYTYKRDTILSINDILKNIAYLMIYSKNLFNLNNPEEIYEKLINYTLGKINYFKIIIRLIINKYNINVIKTKNTKHFLFMKNLLGTNDENMPNILNLRLDPNDFKFTNKTTEKDINFQIFIEEKINIEKFVYPKKNLGELLNYFKSYFDILEISLNSLIYFHIKNININNNNTPFVHQLEKDLKIYFDNEIKKDELNLIKMESANNGEEILSKEIKKKYENICDKLFQIFDKFPSIIRYQNNFIYDIYKLFFYCKDFILFSGEKYIIKTILLLCSISFPEFHQKIFENLNIEFKFKYNNGKDFLMQKIETIKSIFDDISSVKSDKENKRYNSSNKVSSSHPFYEKEKENIYINSKKSNLQINSKSFFSDLNKLENNNFISKSVINLQKDNEHNSDHNFDIMKSTEELNQYGSNKNINENIEINVINNEEKYNNDNVQNKIFLIRRLIIEFIIGSKYSLKIFYIINNIIKENNKNIDESIILFLLLCKWRIINEQNLKRNEDINIFKNKNKIKNYFNKDIYNISIENLENKKTASIKSPISSFNYIINNNYKNLGNKDSLKILTQALVGENNRKNVENILNQRGFQDNNNNININKKFSGKTDSNTFSYRSSSKILNEIKELEEEDNNLSNSDDKNNNNEQKDEENNLSNEDINIPNIEELISVMHQKTKNNLFQLYDTELNKASYIFNNIDKTLLYNEININVSYIINPSNKEPLFNLYKSTFMKFLKKLTSKEETTNLPYTQIKLNEQKEFIYSDNYNIIKYFLNNIEISSEPIDSHIYLIFNDSLKNEPNISNFLINNNIGITNNFVYLYIIIIPVSDEFWKLEFKCNEKQSDEFSKRIKKMVEMNFLRSYFLSIKNNFGYIIYHLKILLSLLQDLICNIKNDIKDNKLKNRLTGIQHEEMFERIQMFKSINL